MIPTMVLAYVIMIGISSRPVDKNSPMFSLMEKKWPNGKPIIKTRIFISVCDACRRRGHKSCGHTPEDHWSNPTQNKKIEYLMSDRSSVYQREMLNMDVGDGSEPAFDPHDLAFLDAEKNDYSGTGEAPYVYITIDPAAGGDKSKYAMVSVITPRVRSKRTKEINEYIVIVGCDILDSRDPKSIYTMLALHMKKLRQVPGCSNSLFVVMPENMLGLEAEHISEALKREIAHGYVIFSEKENEKGFKTDNLFKMSMAKAFRDELRARRVRFHTHFFTLTTPSGRYLFPSFVDGDVDGAKVAYNKDKPMHLVMKTAAGEMRDVWLDHMQRYTRFVKPSKDQFGEATIIYSGKHNGPGDDLAVMTQAAYTLHKYFLTRERYKNYHRTPSAAIDEFNEATGLIRVEHSS